MAHQSTSRRTAAEEDLIEAKAFINLYSVAPQSLLDQAHFSCMKIGAGCAISLPSAPAIGLNRIVGLSSLDELEAAYGWMSRKVGRRYLQLNAEWLGQDTRDWIGHRGLIPEGNGWSKLRLSAPDAPLGQAGDATTRQVKIGEAETFGRMMCAGFGFPANLAPLWSSIVGKEGWTCFFAELDGRPISTGAMYASGGWAWLGGGTTVPEFRNRGAQKALIAARVNEGINKGVETFVVETAQPSAGELNISHANLVAMGFDQIHTRANYRFHDN
jgi:hypothetical protein